MYYMWLYPDQSTVLGFWTHLLDLSYIYYRNGCVILKNHEIYLHRTFSRQYNHVS